MSVFVLQTGLSDYNSPGEYNGMFSLLDGEMFEGDIPLKEQRIVEKFIKINQEKLIRMWETQEFEVIPPVE